MSRKLLAIGLLATSMMAAPAMAATTIAGTTSITVQHDTDPGLVISTTPGSFSFQLDRDSSTATPRSFTTSVFQISSPENSVQLFEDTTPYDIIVNFSFTDPTGIGATPITGSTRGVWLFQTGLVTWGNDPVVFDFGDGGQFSVKLEDTFFALNNATTNVNGKFKLLSDATPAVPEPATWAMMIAGFGLIGASMRRRQKVSVTYA
jgi:hypothetical protein